MHTGELMEVTGEEVLILDTNTFVAEIGLTSRDGMRAAACMGVYVA